MSPELTVVVDTAEAEDPRELLRSVDRSTLSPDRFELVLLVEGDGTSSGRWSRFAGQRPNARLVDAGAPEGEIATGTYELRLRANQRLFPEALTRLLELADRYGLDAVAGREVAPEEPLAGLLLEDATEVTDPEQQARLLVGPTVLRRRTTAPGADDPPRGGRRVGVLGSYPSTARSVGTGTAGATSAAAVGVIAAGAHWQDSALLLSLSGQAQRADPAGARPVLLVREMTSDLSFPVRGSATSAVVADGSVTWSLEATLDLRTAAAGAPLASGEWQLEVALVSSGGSSVAVPVPATSVPVALVDDRIVVSSGPVLVLDIGPTARGCQQLPIAAGATVSESAAGCRLDLALTGWHVVGSRPLPVQIALDRLLLPAHIVPDSGPGTTTLTAYVSGLAGTYLLGLQLGRAPLQPTGLAVVIGGDGAVTVTTAPAKAPAKSTASAPAGAAPKPKPKAPAALGGPSGARTGSKTVRERPRPVPATGPIARLRRAVPASWEPRVHRLSQVQMLRTTYRRLTGLGRS